MPAQDSLQGDYAVAEGQNLTIEAHLGEGLLGVVTVHVGPAQVFSGERTPPEGVSAGAGASLVGQVVQVVGRGRQAIPTSSWASLHVRLAGGAEPREIVLRELVSAKEAATFLVRLKVVAP